MDESVAHPVDIVNMHQPGRTVRRILREGCVQFGRIIIAAQNTRRRGAMAK
jgi:hypothetical protein